MEGKRCLWEYILCLLSFYPKFFFHWLAFGYVMHSFYRCAFDPIHGGEMKQQEFARFMKPDIEVMVGQSSNAKNGSDPTS